MKINPLRIWILLPLVLTAAALPAGCTRLRFVIDAIPADDRLVETTVLDDRPPSRRGRSRAKIAMIDVNGTIADARRSEVFSDGENPVARFTEALRIAENDHNVRAVIIRLNSPGGAVTASDVMYREVQHVKAKTGKPVVMLMGDTAASGAYYLACAGDEIIAHPTTVTGSIGVIIQTFSFSEGLNRIGIRAESITSGSNKAMGSPFEPMSEEHRALLQGLVDEFYGRFRSIVTEARPGLSEADLEWVTDGRVVSGERAAEIGLVDRTGDLHDAFARAKELAKIPAARLVKYHRPLDFVGSAYSAAPTPQTQVNLMQLNLDGGPLPGGAGFYYLWDPMAW
ncbi:MAG: signal peptide peptidase SppA [Phycisphaerales bacterium]|nr:MAG: signal peptide peptidase SppA [Phycisphaerales bacterium]